MRANETLLLLGLLCATPALADDARTLRAVLGSPDQIPTAAQVTALDGEGAQLRAIVADRRETRYLRMRAASLLGLYDRPEVRGQLARVADAADDDVEVRVQALDALARLEGGTERLARALSSPHKALRETAVIGLVRLRAHALLDQHLTLERDPGIRARIAASNRLRR